ncbi:MAG: hypothetical protein ACQESG_08440 [Nanobdellota archaeon]
MIEARFKINEYTKRVLDVIKGRYGLSNRNEALRQLILKATNTWNPKMRLRERDTEYEHHKKTPQRKMTN